MCVCGGQTAGQVGSPELRIDEHGRISPSRATLLEMRSVSQTEWATYKFLDFEAEFQAQKRTSENKTCKTHHKSGQPQRFPMFWFSIWSRGSIPHIGCRDKIAEEAAFKTWVFSARSAVSWAGVKYFTIGFNVNVKASPCTNTT